MERADQTLIAALKTLPQKPADDAAQKDKKRYSELLSEAAAQAFAEELRQRGLKGALPAPPGETGLSGAERRMAGGIGAKKVDVTWATEESGLLLGISVKSINFVDRRSGNFQKNLTNRRGDMLFEAVTLHRRFPYAVLMGVIFLDIGAYSDNTEKRKSTFDNAHHRFKMFTGREDIDSREEQFERLYIALHESNPFSPIATLYEVGKPEPISFASAFDSVLRIVGERNPDFYDVDGSALTRV